MATLKQSHITALLMISIVFGASFQAAAVTIDPILQEQFANELFDNGQYLRAAEEYQRYAFFFARHAKRREMLFKAGKSFLLANDPSTALKLFNQLTSDTPLDEIAVEAFFMAARCQLQMNAATHAVVQLNNLVALSDDPAVEDRAYYRIAWIHINRLDWNGALQSLSRISPQGAARYDVKAIMGPLEKASAIPQKSPVAAGMLSILPGGGQLYCHRYKDALIAFVLNVGTFWAAHEAFDNDQPALGGLLAFVGVGFYAGNIYGAVNDARKYNIDQKRRYIHQLEQQSRRSEIPSPSAGDGIVIGLRVAF
jgi:hypothetical protein